MAEVPERETRCFWTLACTYRTPASITHLLPVIVLPLEVDSNAHDRHIHQNSVPAWPPLEPFDNITSRMEESYERSDIESSLRSYRSRAVDFKEVLESGELGRQRNVGDETRTKIIQQEFSGSGMIASITRVCYGTFNKRKAGIIVFQFLFHWSSDGYQVRCLDVEITFEPRSKRARRAGVDNTLLPVVLNLSPRKAYGIPNSGGRKWLYSVEQQTNDRPSSTVKSATCNVGQKAFEEAHRLEIVGTPWSDSRRREPHKACWTIKEIGRQIFGLPDEINVAVLVECEDDFQADVRLTLDLPLYRRLLRGFPWPADDPILFTPKWNETLIGKPLRTTQFETLSDADWDLLISGYEVRLMARGSWHDLLIENIAGVGLRLYCNKSYWKRDHQEHQRGPQDI